MRTFALVALFAAVASAEYTQASSSAKVGEFKPLPPPEKESTHLKKLGIKASDRIPAPVDGVSFMETAEDDKTKAAAASPSVKKVPHNWFGSGKFTAPAYSVATGQEECDVCKSMIKAKRSVTDVESQGKKGFCDNVGPSFKEMCSGYSKYLEECPSFVHNICHQDVGGAERLLSPCPEHLTCYYCLRVNPLYCLN